MAPDPAGPPQGTLDLLILKSLSLSEMHGLGIAKRVEREMDAEFRSFVQMLADENARAGMSPEGGAARGRCSSHRATGQVRDGPFFR